MTGERTYCRRSIILPLTCIGVVVGAILLFILLYIFVWRSDGTTFTQVVCRIDDCPDSAVPRVHLSRALGNKVDQSFEGYLDVWASRGADVFTADMKVEAGQAWPRIFQGVTYPLIGNAHTPGFPKTVASFLEKHATTRYVSYNATWRPRRNGPNAQNATEVSGNLYNGAYLWFNDRANQSQWDGYPKPRWPFGVEVNIWHRYAGTGHRAGATRFPDYYDERGRYDVLGHHTQHDGDHFYAYYVLLERARWSSDFVININELVKHLSQFTGTDNKSEGAALTTRHELIEVAIAAEGREKADGQFKARVFTMGRTEEERIEDGG